MVPILPHRHLKKTSVIIGAGVIGNALAFKLSQAGHNIVVLEQGPRIAEGVTSRNSGVIHAGIYYPPQSLKAKLCIEGKNKLYEWCQSKNIPHRKTGKYILGSFNEEEELDSLYQNAKNSGVDKIKKIPFSEIQSLPHLHGECGLYSEDSGIVDPFELAYSFQVAAESHGAYFSLGNKVIGIKKLRDYQFKIETLQGEIECELVFNCAGLNADTISTLVGINKYSLYPWRGDYFKIRKKLNIPYLIYPIKKKNAAGLGIHLTLSLDGSLKLGPDVYPVTHKEDFFELTQEDYIKKRSLFYIAAKKYLKDIEEKDLYYDTCGIRPKLRSPIETEEKDFMIAEDIPGFYNLIGIESPGLTSCLAIADYTKNLI